MSEWVLERARPTGGREASKKGGKRKEQTAWSRDKKKFGNRVSPSFYQIIGRMFQRPHKILGYKVPGSAHLDLYLRGVWARFNSKVDAVQKL